MKRIVRRYVPTTHMKIVAVCVFSILGYSVLDLFVR